MSLRTLERRYVERGAYALCGMTGTMVAGAAAASPIYTFRWAPTDAAIRAVIDRIAVSLMSLGTGFAAGAGSIDAVFARSFTAADTGGGVLTITGDNGKRKTTFPTTALQEIRVATTAALSAGTRTLDAQAFSTVQFGVSTATNTVHLATTNLYQPDARTYQEVLSANEGFVLRATVPATGTWQAIVCVEWREVK